MEQLIPIVNCLQDALISADGLHKSGARGSLLQQLRLPSIAVVGSQSAGKSSVLQSLVARDFLPRGTGIVTRCPLVVQVVNEPGCSADYAQFSHLPPGSKLTDFSKVTEEILRETNRIAGTDESKGISARPIGLKLHTRDCVDLTLVDLPVDTNLRCQLACVGPMYAASLCTLFHSIAIPGIIKVPVGAQPNDIETQIRELILSYINDENCLILAICPANVDLANSDALKLAQEVDPYGKRTIGVLTKLDLMDDGTDARNILLNQVIPLAYGYVGVVNRGQKNVDGSQSLADALTVEREYLRSHAAYSDLAECQGTEYLRRKLHQHLTMHIVQCLPDLKRGLRDRINDAKMQLSNMQSDVDYSDPEWRPKTLIMLMVDFITRLKTAVLGINDAFLSITCASPGARLQKLLQYDFKEQLQSLALCQDEWEMKKRIGFLIQNIYGVRPGLFTPDKAFDELVRSILPQMQPCLEQLLDAVTSELNSAISQTCSETFESFPAMAQCLESKMLSVAAFKSSDTGDNLKMLLGFEHAYINTRHEDFIGFSYAEQKAYTRVLKRRQPDQETSKRGRLRLTAGQHRRAPFHFELGPSALELFTDDSKSVRLYSIRFDAAQLNLSLSAANTITLASADGKSNIFHDCKSVDLLAEDEAELRQWASCFVHVGVFCADGSVPQHWLQPPTSAQVLGDQQFSSAGDPWLERQMESVWLLADSYLRIVRRTLADLVPKCVAHSLLKGTIKHLEGPFLAAISREQELHELMQEDNEKFNRKQQLQKVLEECQGALNKLEVVQIDQSQLPKVLHKVELPPPPPRPPKPPRTYPSPTLKNHVSVDKVDQTPDKQRLDESLKQHRMKKVGSEKSLKSIGGSVKMKKKDGAPSSTFFV